MTREDMAIVMGLPLFANLPEEKLRRLLKGAEPRSYPKGQLLFQQGDPAGCFFIVFDGWVKLFRMMPDGQEAVIGVFTRGECFAEAAMFTGIPFPASAEVAENARLLRIVKQPFTEWLDAGPEAVLNMLASMSRHLHQLVKEVEQLKTRSATQRVADFLLKLCPVREGSAVIALPYDKSLLAARVGMKPESLSRVLAKLRELGIRSEHNRVIISEVADLVAYCEDGSALAGSQRISGPC